MIGPQAARPLRVTRRHSIRRRNPRERQRRADEVPGRPPHSVAAAKTRPPSFVAPCFAPFRVASPLYRPRPHYPASVALSAGLKHPSASNATTVHVAPPSSRLSRTPVLAEREILSRHTPDYYRALYPLVTTRGEANI